MHRTAPHTKFTQAFLLPNPENFLLNFHFCGGVKLITKINMYPTLIRLDWCGYGGGEYHHDHKSLRRIFKQVLRRFETQRAIRQKRVYRLKIGRQLTHIIRSHRLRLTNFDFNVNARSFAPLQCVRTECVRGNESND